MEITFLGTGSMQPTKQRNHSGILLSYKNENILLDCGEGTQRQMRIAGIKPAKITRLLISHWHGDHVFGIPGLLSSMGADKPESTLKIYGPAGTKKFIEYMLKGFVVKDVIGHEIHEVKAGRIVDMEDFFIEAHALKHSAPCFGYAFMEKDRLRIEVTTAKKLGLEGPILGQIQQGKDVEWKGKKVKAKEVTYIQKGKKVSYIADTLPCEGAYALAKDADLLISEGTHLDEIKEKTEKYKHLTVKQAALIASESNAQKLIITHLSPRYKRSLETAEEARTYFPNSLVAEDFMKVKV
ncbi:MAG: ribonuclease Z [Nanoarchaeota archaeon]